MVETVVATCPGSVLGLGFATGAVLVDGFAVGCEDSPWRGSLLVVDLDPTGFVVDPAASVVLAVSVVLEAPGVVLVILASGAPVVVDAVFVLCRCVF